jgi:hypothetical protein
MRGCRLPLFQDRHTLDATSNRKCLSLQRYFDPVAPSTPGFGGLTVIFHEAYSEFSLQVSAHFRASDSFSHKYSRDLRLSLLIFNLNNNSFYACLSHRSKMDAQGWYYDSKLHFMYKLVSAEASIPSREPGYSILQAEFRHVLFEFIGRFKADPKNCSPHTPSALGQSYVELALWKHFCKHPLLPFHSRN